MRTANASRLLIGGAMALAAAAPLAAAVDADHLRRASPEERRALDALAAEIEGVVVYGRQASGKGPWRIEKMVIGEWKPIDLGEGWSARWSPDGARLAVFVPDGPDDSGRIDVMDADGGNRRTVVRDAYAHWGDGCPMGWTSDGASLVYVRAGGPDPKNGNGLWRVDLASGAVEDFLTDLKQADGSPDRDRFTGDLQFSADGRYMTVRRRLQRAHRPLCWVDVESGVWQQYGHGCGAAISPDGLWLLNNHDGHARMTIHHRTGPHKITTNCDGMQPDRAWDNPYWSNHLDYFACEGDGAWEDIYVFRVSERRWTRVTFFEKSDRCEYGGLFVTAAHVDSRPSASAPADEPAELVARWTFDDPAAPGRDASGNGLDGEARDGAHVTTDAAVGSGALRTDGRGAAVVVPADSALDRRGTVTISLWFRIDEAFGPDSPSRILLDKFVDADHNLTLVLAGDDYDKGGWGDGRLVAKLENDDVGRYVYLRTARTAWEAGRWYHVAVVFDADAATGSALYVDGRLDVEEIDGEPGPIAMSYVGPLTIGGGRTDPGQLDREAWFAGAIDDVRLYDGRLSEEAIAALHSRTEPWPTTERGLVFRWADGSDANPVHDAGGAVVRLCEVDLHGFAHYARGSVMAFRGTGPGRCAARIDEARALLEACRASDAFTVELTFTPAEREREGRLLHLGPSREPDLAIDQRGRAVELTLAGADRLHTVRLLELAADDVGEPQHLVLAYADGRLRAYRDGEALGRATRFGDGLGAWRGGELCFGDRPDGARPWRGRIEGLALYARALSAGEAADEHAAYAALRAARPAAPALEVDARLVQATPLPDPSELVDYPRCLVAHVYAVEQVHAGEAPGDLIEVIHWAILGQEPLPSETGRREGGTYRLRLEPFEANGQVHAEQLVTELDVFDLPRYLHVEP